MGAKQSTPKTPSDDAALREIVAGVESETGDRFFYALVKHLASALECEYAFASEILEDRSSFRTRAVWGRGTFIENFETPLKGTPCEAVLNGEFSHYPEQICQLFPADAGLKQWGVESYCGVPLLNSSGMVVGHLAILSERPMWDGPRGLAIMRIFASRAHAELERLRTEKDLRVAAGNLAELQKVERRRSEELRHANETLAQSEERFRDLFDEAPIAYVHEDLDTRFIEANRTAMRILGLKPEEIGRTFGKSLVPDTPEAQRRLSAALDSIRRGTDTSGVLLELRRKDDGKPVWVQWWSRPAAGGSHTRTMFIDVTDRVLMEREQARLEAQNTYLVEEIKQAHNFEKIVGQSRVLAEVIEKVKLVASTDSSVLILGETGTGKELVARAVHSNSERRNRPLVKVNCAALPTGLIEAELFGHEKGAFTGATEKRLGRFELAHGGTIFLDEIGEMPAEAQVKLLRVLQEHEFERLGGRETIKVDVRVVAATNRDLLRAVADGAFRQDLYYRLSVFPLRVPSLRERRGDIPLLVHYFVGRYAARIGRKIASVARETMERLVAYPWPGNIRELENVIERAVILSAGAELEVAAEALPVTIETAPGRDLGVKPGRPQVQDSADANPLTLEEMERRHIVEVLNRTTWKIDGPNGAAVLLNLNPSTLRSRIKKLGIRRSSDIS
ncbi:MAG: sigma-54 interaction domain-containing protein [Candidatus Binataceae bacterium]